MGDAITYEEFGVNFITLAITPGRVGQAVRDAAGESITIEPLKAGPGNVADVEATGRIGEPRVRRVGDTPLQMQADLPVDLALTIRLAGSTHRMKARLEVPLRLTIRVEEPLCVVADVEEIDPGEVSVRVAARGVAAKVLQRVGNVEEEIRRRVAPVINEIVSSERALASRVIDILPLIQRAWPEGDE